MPVKKRKPAKPTKRPAKKALPNHRGRVGVGIAQYSGDIRRLRLAGTTLAGIADWLRTTHDMPVTRERVRQVLTKLLTTEEHRAVLEAAKPPTMCSVCGREGRTTKGLCPAHHARRLKGATDAELAAPIKVSSHEPSKCLGTCGRMIGPGTSHTRNRGRCSGCYSNWAYHNLPGRKQAVRKTQQKWLNKRMKSAKFRKHFKALQAKAKKRYYEKNAKRIAAERKAAKKALPKKAPRKKALAGKKALA